MATMLEELLLKGSVLLGFFFFWAKGHDAKDVHEEMFSVYDGKCLSCKAVHNWVEEFSQEHLKVAGDA
jgi:hypothetical protein